MLYSCFKKNISPFKNRNNFKIDSSLTIVAKLFPTCKKSYFVNDKFGQGVWSLVIKNLGFWKSWCAPISLKLPWSGSRAPKNFLCHKCPRTFLFYRFTQSVLSPTRRHLESVWRRIFFWGGGLWNSSMVVSLDKRYSLYSNRLRNNKTGSGSE